MMIGKGKIWSKEDSHPESHSFGAEAAGTNHQDPEGVSQGRVKVSSNDTLSLRPDQAKMIRTPIGFQLSWG